MRPIASRRAVLRGVSAGAAASLAGCSSLNPLGCSDHYAASVRAEPADSPEGESVDPLRLDELPPAQRELVAEAVRTGEYRVCPYSEAENREAISDLGHTVAEHRGSQHQAYLAYDGEYYALSVLIEDEMY